MPNECPACSRPGTERSNPQGEAWERESVSRNAIERELDSASLIDVRVANLPSWAKPATTSEATFIRSWWTLRGDWRQRTEKGKSRNLGDPDGLAMSALHCGEQTLLYGQKIVAASQGVGQFHSSKERPNPPGAKGTDCKHAKKEA